MQFGAHVRSSGGLLAALARGARLGADAVQVHTQSPRMWRAATHDAATLSAVRAELQGGSPVRAAFCHATYLVNLATSDATLLGRSRTCLADNLYTASAMGARGLVLHIGSHLGSGFDGCREQVAKTLVAVLDEVEERLGATPCPILLENAAGAGGTVGRSFSELGEVIEAADGDERLGVCLDTQHLFASGVAFATPEQADAALAELHRRVGLDRLGCLHLNDSKVPLGANRDRHANLGEGEIGEEALGMLLGHPDLQATVALLEVPGDGDGPRQCDIELARKLHAEGRARYRGRRPRRR